MKAMDVNANNYKKVLEVKYEGKSYTFPYAKLEIRPAKNDRIVKVYVDPEIGGEGFTYVLQSGAEGTVHWDHVLDHNKDPEYLREIALHKLTLLAQDQLRQSGMSKGEIGRRLGTSASQLIRLLDQTNYTKSVDQMLRLLAVLDCPVEFVAVKQQRLDRDFQPG